MERLILEIGIVIIAFLIGYWMGFRACFGYLYEEIQKKMEEDDE